MNRKARAIMLLTIGAVGVAAALAMHLPGVALAIFLVFGFIASSLHSEAGRLADAISQLKGHRVHVSVWGAEIPGLTAGELQLDSATSIGAGLHLSLRSGSGLRGDLKVAQPSSATVTAGSVEIQNAKYVSWKGQQIKRPQNYQGAAVTVRGID